MRYQMLFRIEAKGVTPIPAPTRTAISYLNTSSDALPNGPSMNTRGRILLSDGSRSRAEAFWSRPTTAEIPRPGRSLLSVPKLQPTAAARAVVKSPTHRMWTEM